MNSQKRERANSYANNQTTDHISNEDRRLDNFNNGIDISISPNIVKSNRG